MCKDIYISKLGKNQPSCGRNDTKCFSIDYVISTHHQSSVNNLTLILDGGQNEQFQYRFECKQHLSSLVLKKEEGSIYNPQVFSNNTKCNITDFSAKGIDFKDIQFIVRNNVILENVNIVLITNSVTPFLYDRQMEDSDSINNTNLFKNISHVLKSRDKHPTIIHITNSVIENAGIYIRDHTNVVFQNTTFKNFNNSESTLISISDCQDVVIRDCLFVNNTAEVLISSSANSMMIARTNFTRNSIKELIIHIFEEIAMDMVNIENQIYTKISVFQKFTEGK